MRLVTVNLYNGRVVPRDLLRFLDEVRPEVLCAQEVGPDAGRILERWFPHGRVEPSMSVDGRAMVSIHDIAPQTLDLPFRGGYRGTISLEGRPIEVVSVHLANPVDGPSGLRARRDQLAGLDAIVSDMGDGVLVGDMNATPIWPAYRRLRRHLEDGVASWAERTGVRAPATWAQMPSWPALLRIDHVFTRGVNVAHARTERIAGLDHRALVADLGGSAT